MANELTVALNGTEPPLSAIKDAASMEDFADWVGGKSTLKELDEACKKLQLQLRFEGKKAKAIRIIKHLATMENEELIR